MRALLIAAITLGFAFSAFGAEPEGCDKFKWPIAQDQSALKAPDRIPVASGSVQDIPPKAMTLSLQSLDAANLPMPPEKKRGEGNLAGYLTLSAPKAGSYTLSMSSAVWIDVIQDGRFVKPAAFSGATGCDGIRKTMRFDLSEQPFVVQVSGSVDPAVALWLHPSD